MTTTRILSPDNTCRECGCTDLNGCVVDLASGDVVSETTFHSRVAELGYDQALNTLTSCYWAEPDLCSACAELDAPCAAEAPPLLYDGAGRPLKGTP